MQRNLFLPRDALLIARHLDIEAFLILKNYSKATLDLISQEGLEQISALITINLCVSLKKRSF